MAAATIDAQIPEALFKRLAALVLSPVLTIAWPGEAFAPPASGKYLRVDFLPNTTNRPLIDSDGPHQHQGILQVSVVWPINAGEIVPRDLAGAIAAWFPADMRLAAGATEVRVTGKPSIASMLINGNNATIPVSVPFDCWA